MKGSSLNTGGYIMLNSQEWGDIIILKMELFQELMTIKEQSLSSNGLAFDKKPHSDNYFYSKEFGNWIHNTLKEKKITQHHLAVSLKTTQATISRIVSCSKKVVPSLEMRKKIYEFLMSC